MRFDGQFAERQAKTGRIHFQLLMDCHLPELLKDPGMVFPGDAGAIVDDLHRYPGIRVLDIELYAPVVGHVFYGICADIGNYAPYQFAVARNHGRTRLCQFQPAIRLQVLQGLDDFAGQTGQIACLGMERHVPGLHPADVEQ